MERTFHFILNPVSRSFAPVQPDLTGYGFAGKKLFQSDPQIGHIALHFLNFELFLLKKNIFVLYLGTLIHAFMRCKCGTTVSQKERIPIMEKAKNFTLTYRNHKKYGMINTSQNGIWSSMAIWITW